MEEKSKEKQQLAFPLLRIYADEMGLLKLDVDPGMTLRDYFAAKAMQKLAGMSTDEEVASASYQVADAMMREREIGDQEPSNEANRPV